MNTFHIRMPDGERATINLYSLDEYESDAGIYADAEDGLIGLRISAAEMYDGDGDGEISAERLAANRQAARELFVAAAACPSLNDAETADAMEAAGIVDPGTAWIDSSTGYWLLREWPADAALAAR